jgi:hypothetical protein
VLVIRQAQMRALEEAALSRQVQSKLQRALPHRTSALSKRELRTKVEQSFSHARSFGLGDDQLLAFTAFELVFGGEFSRDSRFPWAQKILNDRSLSPTDKMQSLREAGIFYLAAEAEEAEWNQRQQDRETAHAAG